MLTNLKSLKKDMVEKSWNIDSFTFEYNKQEFIILIILYDVGEKKPKYSLVKIEFIKIENINESMVFHANTTGLIIEKMKEFREFFKIEYSEKLGDIIQSFTKNLANFIPSQVLNNKTEDQKELMALSLNRRTDADNPNKIYCYKVARNGVKLDGKPKKRGIYNDNITQIRRPSLYEKLKTDLNLSFYYSENVEIEKTDEEIMLNWARNPKNNKL